MSTAPGGTEQRALPGPSLVHFFFFVCVLHLLFFGFLAIWIVKGLLHTGLLHSHPVKSSRARNLESLEESSFCNRDIAKLAQSTDFVLGLVPDMETSADSNLRCAQKPIGAGKGKTLSRFV